MTDERVSDPGPGRAGAVPPPLRVAAALTGIEAFLLVVIGGGVIRSLQQDRVALGVTTLVFFLVYGGALAWCAWQLWRRRASGRSFAVFAQLIQLGVAWSFKDAPFTYLAIVLAVVALVVLAGIFHPQSLRALESD